MVEVLNSIADGWAAYQWAMFWQVGLLIAILWIIDVSIHKWVWPQVRYALWLLVLVKLVIPPTLSSPASVTSHIPAAAEKVVSVRLNETPALDNEVPASGGTGVSPVTNLPAFKPNNDTQAGLDIEPQTSSPRDETAGWHGQALLGRGVSEQEFPSLQQPDNSGPAKGKSGAAERGYLSWKVYAMFAWLAGVVVLTTWLAARLRGLRIQHIPSNCHAGLDPASRQYRPGPRLDGRGDSAQFEALLKAAAARLNLKRLPEVIVTDRVACPAVFGVLRPVLLMPAAKLEHLDSRDMEHILLHELAHIKRGDLVVHAVYMCLQIAYWFNPLLWMIRKTLQNLRELCCDATVARLLKDDTVHYRQTLLETARGLVAQPVDPGLGLLGLFENSSWLATRLQWLEKKTWKNRPLRIATVMVLVSVMAVCVLPMAAKQTTEDGSRMAEFRRAAIPVQNTWMADIKDQDGQVFSFVHGEVLRFPNLADENALLRIPEGDLFCNYDRKQQKPKVTFLRSARLGGSGQGGSSLAFTVIPMKMPYVNTVTTAEGLVFEIRIVAGDEEVCLIEYRPMNETAEQALKKQKGVAVTGQVTDAATGRPIARAVVCDDGYDGGKRRTFTDDVGRFVLRTAREEHAIAAKAKGYDWQRKTLKTWPFANHQKFDFNLSPLPAGVQEAVLLPEYYTSKTVLSLKTGQFVPEQQTAGLNEPYLAFSYSAGRQPQKRTVHNAPEDELGVHAGQMDLAGGGFGKDYEAAQGMWLAQSVGQLPDFKMSRMTRKVSRETMNTSDSFFINRHANTDWPYITAFRGDDGTHGVLEITKVQDRKIHVRFRTIDSVTSEQSPVTSEGQKTEAGSQKPEAESASDLANVNSELKTQNSSFTAALPNGVTVELLGISEHPSEGKQWWSADGHLFNEAPYEYLRMRSYPVDSEAVYELAFQSLQFYDDVSVQIKAVPNKGTQGVMIPEKDAKPLLNLRVFTVEQSQGVDTCDVSLGIAAGTWQKIGSSDGTPSTIAGLKRNISFSKAFESEKEQVVIMVSDDMLDKNHRIVAVDRDGTIVKSQNWNSSQVGQLRQTTVQFDGYRLQDIQEFQFQIRSYEWVIFKNVALRAGVKTNVQVVTENPDKPSAVTSDQSPVASEGQKTVAASASDSMKSQPAGIQYIFKDGQWVVDKESAAKLEFRVAPKKSELPEGELKSLEIELKEKWPYVENRLWVWRLADPSFDTASERELATTEHNGRTYVLVMNVPEMCMLADGSWGIESAAVVQDAQERPAVEVTFDGAGGALFYALTQKSIGQRLAILINDKVVSAPKVQSAIRDRAIIAGTFTTDRAQQLASSLERGMLPAGPVDLTPAKFEVVYNKERGVHYLVVKIKNESDVALPKHRIRYYRGDPAQRLDETGHPHSGWHEAGPVAPGEEWNERTSDFHLPDGEYDFTVVLDYDNVITETNEDNNTATLKVRIQDGRIVESSPETDAVDVAGSSGGTPSKVLQFPEADTLNLLFIANSDGERKWWWPLRDPQGTAWPAQGRIVVESNAALGLMIFAGEKDSADPLPVLDGLDVNDLHTLVIHGNSRGGAEPAVIDENIRCCVRLSGLKCLILNNVGITDGAITEIGQMQGLERLCIVSDDLEDEHVAQIAQLKNLRGLRVCGNLGNASAESIAAMGNLQELLIEGMYLSNDSLYAISQMKNLRELALSKELHTEDGLQYLAAMPSLQTLDLMNFELSPADAEYIAKIPNLKSLSINREISDEAVEKLSRLDSLMELTLSTRYPQRDGLTDAALHSLAKLKNLKSLDIGYGQFTDDGFKQLAQLPRLKRVMIPNCTISEDVYQYLVTTLPDLKEAYFRNFPDLRDPRYKIPLPLHLLPTLDRTE